MLSVTFSASTRSGSASPVTETELLFHMPMSSKPLFSSRYVKWKAGPWFTSSKPRPGALCQTPTSRSGSLKGRGFNRTPFTTLKMALLAPIPTASVVTATIVNNGVLTNLRVTYRNWVLKDCIPCLSTKRFEPAVPAAGPQTHQDLRPGRGPIGNEPDPRLQLVASVPIRSRSQKGSSTMVVLFPVSRNQRDRDRRPRQRTTRKLRLATRGGRLSGRSKLT